MSTASFREPNTATALATLGRSGLAAIHSRVVGGSPSRAVIVRVVSERVREALLCHRKVGQLEHSAHE
jgi:hypothetical protein